MHYKKRNESKYQHLATPEKVILGINKDWEIEEASILEYSPINLYEPGMLKNIMSLTVGDRGILIDSIDEYVWLHRCKEFNNLYWDILTDYIFVIYGYTLNDIAVILEELYESHKKEYTEKYSSKYFYDVLDKLRANKGKIRKETHEYLRFVCDYFRITDDILTSGSGCMYMIQNTEKYSASAIREYRVKNSDAKIKDMIQEITAVNEEDIIEIPLEIPIVDNIIEDNVKRYIDILIRKMRESRS